VADSRADERDLLTSFGLGPVQQLALALLEASLLAVTSALLAVPAAILAFSWVTHLPDLAAARLSQDPTVTPALVATVVGGAALLTLVLVVAPLVSWDSGRLSARQRVVARSGADALLLLIAVAGWWQLHARSAAATNGDTVLVVAPVLCLAAATIVAVRGLPPLFALAAVQGSRSRSLLPLSLHPGSLRLGAATAPRPPVHGLRCGHLRCRGPLHVATLAARPGRPPGGHGRLTRARRSAHRPRRGGGCSHRGRLRTRSRTFSRLTGHHPPGCPGPLLR